MNLLSKENEKIFSRIFGGYIDKSQKISDFKKSQKLARVKKPVQKEKANG